MSTPVPGRSPATHAAIAAAPVAPEPLPAALLPAPPATAAASPALPGLPALARDGGGPGGSAIRRDARGRCAPPYPDPHNPAVCRVPLSGRDTLGLEALIDAADLPLIEGKRLAWSARTPGKPGRVTLSAPAADKGRPLHHLILGVTGIDHRVGHRNGDPLDCRRANLFVRSKQDQERGKGKKTQYGGRPCSSRFKGVTWDRWTDSWRAGIVVNGKSYNLGRFADETAAAEAGFRGDRAARQHFGPHARPNFPDGAPGLAPPTPTKPPEAGRAAA